MPYNILQKLQTGEKALAVAGLGYVGLPLAVAFADKVRTIAFDIAQEKIALYKQGIDPTQEVGNDKLAAVTMDFTADPSRLKEAGVIITAVPTPVNRDKTPDLAPVINASRIIGENLSPGTIVIFESTVYPGVTEDICLPILEKHSGLTGGKDFFIGYSPERINPGDKVNRLQNIQKIVGGMNAATTEVMAAIYDLVITAGTHKTSCIKVAEAAKLAENAQRDINIAFMNELAMAFDRIGISTKEVLNAMNTKWNALGFQPGLVGGHCIGVDPYYLIYQATMLGYHSQIISAGRRINDVMSRFVTDKVIRHLILAGKNVQEAKVYIFGVTFKENCPDMRNSKAAEIYHQLAAYGMNLKIIDPVVDTGEFHRELAMNPASLSEVADADCLVFLVAHDAFRQLAATDFARMFGERRDSSRIIIDVKSIFSRKEMEQNGYVYWSL
ncbi:nucleotide sugar dehydrogenase [Sporomusa sphaeroides]|jgi:UDP-N-acetyl-D-galactosamine dehydrogenase|uniref:nucleotide sugar dehydrogenase n=1 Tax=Sporomusa sphaeroides TaxID=47679 RepID=UPI003DA0C706